MFPQHLFRTTSENRCWRTGKIDINPEGNGVNHELVQCHLPSYTENSVSANVSDGELVIEGKTKNSIKINRDEGTVKTKVSTSFVKRFKLDNPKSFVSGMICDPKSRQCTITIGSY